MNRGIRFDGQVAIVTGAGAGLGRAYALELARLGAHVLVNDVGRTGSGADQSSPADDVVSMIVASGGTALAFAADVADPTQASAMVEHARDRWGRVDILINNAGILRDSSFAKMSLDDFDLVMKVHLGGSLHCTKAVWPIMRQQSYGRILLTSSASGLYGNFGQANYGAAKASMIGLMNVLHIEGMKYGIRVNALAPTAATAMTAAVLSEDLLTHLRPEKVAPAAVFLVSAQAPSKMIMGAGAGVFAVTHILETEGVYLPAGECSADGIAANLERILAISTAAPLAGALDQAQKFVARAKSGS